MNFCTSRMCETTRFYLDHDADPRIFKEVLPLWDRGNVRILLTTVTEESVDEFLWCFASNKPFDFDNDPDPGILKRNVHYYMIGRIVRIVRIFYVICAASAEVCGLRLSFQCVALYIYNIIIAYIVASVSNATTGLFSAYKSPLGTTVVSARPNRTSIKLR